MKSPDGLTFDVIGRYPTELAAVTGDGGTVSGVGGVGGVVAADACGMRVGRVKESMTDPTVALVQNPGLMWISLVLT
ncbi:hypothetical protein [Streptomyces sp. CB02009]|uniref:hypothetical protein n=1 Tax=Streptomyces sp. CB02009 TaxID=1703938 RepID=UPI0013011ABF|nr:hypothetical protein [Streptomyces sp. CB02009]